MPNNIPAQAINNFIRQGAKIALDCWKLRRLREEGFTADVAFPGQQISAADALEVMREIEAACGLAFTDIVNNSNLGTETTAETVLGSAAFIEELSHLSGLPVWLTAAEYTVAAQLAGKVHTILPMKLQEKYFDLPEQRVRPLFG